jgi:hypothetical protein
MVLIANPWQRNAGWNEQSFGNDGIDRMGDQKRHP